MAIEKYNRSAQPSGVKETSMTDRRKRGNASSMQGKMTSRSLAEAEVAKGGETTSQSGALVDGRGDNLDTHSRPEGGSCTRSCRGLRAPLPVPLRPRPAMKRPCRPCHLESPRGTGPANQKRGGNGGQSTSNFDCSARGNGRKTHLDKFVECLADQFPLVLKLLDSLQVRLALLEIPINEVFSVYTWVVGALCLGEVHDDCEEKASTRTTKMLVNAQYQ
jgi:hypothetical protein